MVNQAVRGAFVALAVSAALADFAPKTWTVNLDNPPETRWPWADLVAAYNATVQESVSMIGQFIPPELVPLVERGALVALDHLGDYAGEIRAAAAAFNLRLADVALLNIMYEVEAGCTSIIVNDPAGTILHGRNLDFLLAGVLRNMTIDVEFQSNGQTVYRGSTYVGYVGLMTGMRPSSFSVSVDQRAAGIVIENILEALLVKGTYVSSLLIRDTLLQNDTFDAAVHRLAHTPLAAPIYIVVGGTQYNEGAVITRDRNGPADIWYLNGTAGGRWFEVVTNWDHWKKQGDDRRDLANQGMEAIGYQNTSLETIFGVLSIPKVVNNMTTYTSIMSAVSDTYNTTVRTYL